MDGRPLSLARNTAPGPHEESTQTRVGSRTELHAERRTHSRGERHAGSRGQTRAHVGRPRRLTRRDAGRLTWIARCARGRMQSDSRGEAQRLPILTRGDAHRLTWIDTCSCGRHGRHVGRRTQAHLDRTRPTWADPYSREQRHVNPGAAMHTTVGNIAPVTPLPHL